MKILIIRIFLYIYYYSFIRQLLNLIFVNYHLSIFLNRVEKAQQNVTPTGTRSRTSLTNAGTKTTEVKVEPKATAEEIKDKLEQQLKLQRAAHQQKKSLDKSATNASSVSTQQVIKILPNSAQQGIIII